MNTMQLNPFELNTERTFALAHFLTACEKEGVKVNGITSVYNGFQVRFEGTEGDAILHDGSVGRGLCLWETYKFPWDEGDVSTHDADELAHMIAEFQKGE